MAQPVKSEGNLVSVFTATSITSGATATSSPGIGIGDCTFFGAWVSVACTGTPHIRVWYEESYDDVSDNYRDPAEIIAGSPVAIGDLFSNLSFTSPQIVNVSLIPMEFVRFKATALSTSDSNVTITMKLFKQ